MDLAEAKPGAIGAADRQSGLESWRRSSGPWGQSWSEGPRPERRVGVADGPLEGSRRRQGLPRPAGPAGPAPPRPGTSVAPFPAATLPPGRWPATPPPAPRPAEPAPRPARQPRGAPPSGPNAMLLGRGKLLADRPSLAGTGSPGEVRHHATVPVPARRSSHPAPTGSRPIPAGHKRRSTQSRGLVTATESHSSTLNTSISEKLLRLETQRSMLLLYPANMRTAREAVPHQRTA